MLELTGMFRIAILNISLCDLFTLPTYSLKYPDDGSHGITVPEPEINRAEAGEAPSPRHIGQRLINCSRRRFWFRQNQHISQNGLME